MTCSLCSESPECAGGEVRKCGFSIIGESGYRAGHVFTSDNFHCATLDRLKSYAMQYGKTCASLECGRVWLLPYPLAGGWIILTAQQKRGHVDTGVYLDDGTAYALPLSIAEKAIEYYRAQKAAGDCEVLP